MIIVTGGAGFIGSNIVKELNCQGRTDILIVDDLNNRKKENQSYRNLRGLQFMDYMHKDAFLEAVLNDDFDGTDVDVVFHEGACSDTMEYDVNYMMEANYEYSKAVLHFCMNHRIPFLYASSASTYGGGENGFREGDECEDALNPYAYSKLLFDRYVRQQLPYAQSQIVGLKYFNVYGPQEHHKGNCQHGAGADEGGAASGFGLTAVGDTAEQGEHEQSENVIQRHDDAGGGLAQAELAGQCHGNGHVVDLPEGTDQEEGEADQNGAFVIELHRGPSFFSIPFHYTDFLQNVQYLRWPPLQIP